MESRVSFRLAIKIPYLLIWRLRKTRELRLEGQEEEASALERMTWAEVDGTRAMYSAHR